MIISFYAIFHFNNWKDYYFLLFLFILSWLFYVKNFYFQIFFASGNGEPIQIFDGRRSLNEDTLVSTQSLQTDGNSDKGQIIYFRDSDDEMPDSDEDPDDDLDIW